MVSFVSKAWGGRTSDKYITEHYKVLDHLIPGDVILADRGFNIAESVGVMQAYSCLHQRQESTFCIGNWADPHNCKC